jgi:type II secretory ATPase GspE/PulE/Tfp pilus assembly ATPase PilB-like protein
MSRKTCSHCLQTGHNRRTCPQRSDQGKQHDATINKRKGRKCSYCLTKGHNRRTCEALEGDFQVFKWLSGKVRQALLDRIVEADLGLGTMFVQEVYELLAITGGASIYSPTTRTTSLKRSLWVLVAAI